MTLKTSERMAFLRQSEIRHMTIECAKVSGINRFASPVPARRNALCSCFSAAASRPCPATHFSRAVAATTYYASATPNASRSSTKPAAASIPFASERAPE